MSLLGEEMYSPQQHMFVVNGDEKLRSVLAPLCERTPSLSNRTVKYPIIENGSL
jgi:hypothetical protein